jgi:pimeloyl-ACP methyl ester carboxylesterase
VRGYLNTKWGSIHYRQAGTEGPAVILFAESPLSSRIFEPALPLLGESLRVWAFDTPGYGLSDAPDEPLSIAEYAERLLGGIQALGLDRFAVGGTHTGALLALEVAVQAGFQRISHVILCGVPFFTEEDRRQYAKRWPDLELDPTGEHLIWAWEWFRRSWGEDSPLELIHLGTTEIVTNYERYNWSSRASYEYDSRPHLPRLDCPTLLLNGEKALFAHTDAEVLDLLPDGRLKVVSGLRGQLPWRVPELYASEIVDFVMSSGAR